MNRKGRKKKHIKQRKKRKCVSSVILREHDVNEYDYDSLGVFDVYSKDKVSQCQ